MPTDCPTRLFRARRAHAAAAHLVRLEGGGKMTTEQANLAPTCVNHPKVETRLTCSSCGDPICPRCMVATAVGQKCPRCARQTGRAKGNPDPQLLARAFGAGVAAAAAGAVVFVFLPFAGILLALAHGFVVAAAV